MAKKLISSKPMRTYHRQPNYWHVVDLGRAREAIDRARCDPKNEAIAVHEGKLLAVCQGECLVARLAGVDSEYAARLYASNGGFSSYQLLRQQGRPTARKYMDERDFAVVETVVLDYWMRQPRLDWDAAKARVDIYAEGGERVLPFLCVSFIPLVATKDNHLDAVL